MLLKFLNQTIYHFLIPVAILSTSCAFATTPKLYRSLLASGCSDCASKCKGCQGVQGPVGPTGPQGIPGPIGPPGPIGQIGEDGPQGGAGIVGPQGPVGPRGATGVDGTSGMTGPTGIQGEDGQQGFAGPLGPTGPTGTLGLAGLIKGNTGPTGPTGFTGTPGPQAIVAGYAYARAEGTTGGTPIPPGDIIPLETLEAHSSGFVLLPTGEVQVPFAGIYLIYYQIMTQNTQTAALTTSQHGVIPSGVFSNFATNTYIAGSTITILNAGEAVGIMNNDLFTPFVTGTLTAVPSQIKATPVAMTIVILTRF